MRPRLLALLPCAAALGTVPLHAQSAFIMGGGISRYDQADALASPLRYGGAGPSVRLAWRRDGTRILWGVAAAFSPARLVPTASSSPSNDIMAYDGYVAAHWLRRLDGGGRGGLYLGGRLHAFASFRRQRFDRIGASEPYGDLIVSLDLAIAWTWRPAGGHRLRADLAVPVTSAAWRTPYFGVKELPSLQLGAPGHLRGVRWNLEYLRAVSSVLALGGRYGFETFHHPDPRSLSVVDHRLEALARLGGFLP